MVIKKDSEGNYVERGWRNVKINGENIKPILAQAAQSYPNVEIFNHVNVANFLIEGGTVVGAYGFSTRQKILYGFTAKVTLIATGGASGIYLPNHAGSSRHQMWYSPFNTGAGYAMRIRAGAEMTTFEMRIIALHCKDTIVLTGYWVDAFRQTTLKNLYAAGDVAGGCPQKYVTGAFAEAEIFAEKIFNTLEEIDMPAQVYFDASEFEKFFENDLAFMIDDLEVAMQTVMDEYAGGLTQNYRFNERQLNLMAKNIERLEKLSKKLHAADMYDLLKIYELRERLTVAKVLIEHLRARRENRWAGFAQNLDYLNRDEDLIFS